MANPNKPSGLTPKNMISGADWDGRGNLYYIDQTDTNAYYTGDVVALSGSGSADGVPGITLATAGNTAVGVIIGLGGISTKGGPYVDPGNLNASLAVPATKIKGYTCLVCDDPNVIFEVQESNGPLAVTDIGLNANLLYAAPSNPVNVYSGMTLNATGKATTSTLNFKILGLVQRADNALGAFAKWRVLINNHAFRAGITGV
jgi:hypothetical protein